MFAKNCSMDDTTGKMVDVLRKSHGMDAHNLDHGKKMFAFRGWSGKRMRRQAERLYDQLDLQRIFELRTGACFVTHSMGFLFMLELLELWEERHGSECIRLADRIITFSPAVSKNVDVSGMGFSSLVVIHNPRDRALMAGSWIPFHPYGFGGRNGLKAAEESQRVENILDPQTDEAPGLRHNHYFTSPFLEQWANWTDLFFRTGLTYPPSWGSEEEILKNMHSR